MKWSCLAVAAALSLIVSFQRVAHAQPFDPLPSVDLSKLSHADFTDDELDCPDGGNNAGSGVPYLLAHFKTVADSISDGSGGKWPRGFIGISVWRGDQNQRTYNARVMENNLALTYFYVTDRPWNVYRGHPGVRQRLEAMFEFMLSEQGPDGQFSEYEAKRWGLAPTAFATKFLGESLTLLRRPGAPQIDAGLFKRVVEMQRRAILFILSDEAFFTHGRRFSNQFGNVWPGGLAYVALFPDDTEVRDKLFAKHGSTHKDFFSPCGFPYENDGPDWGYNLNTHASNQRMARFYTRDKSHPMHDDFVREEQMFHEWLAYNAAIEPTGAGFALNRAIETRGNTAFRGEWMESAFGDEMEIVHAFAPTDVEVAARRAASRRQCEKNWPKVAPLEVGEFRAYSPYDFLHREHRTPTHPTAAQRDAARAKLIPYLARQTFTHQRVDDRRDPAPTFTFVRRPSYYAAFNSGDRRNDQRLGLGLLYHPKLGTLIQSQTGSETHAWGTRIGLDSRNEDDDDEGHLFEANDIVADFTAGGAPVTRTLGNRDLPAGDVVATYALQYGPGGDGTKRVTFFDDRIEVAVTEARPFREQIPLLLLPKDELKTDGTITLRRGGGGVLRIEPTGATRVERVDGRSEVGPYRVSSVHLRAKGQLTYRITVE